jgi:hypothetical protein
MIVGEGDGERGDESCTHFESLATTPRAGATRAEVRLEGTGFILEREKIFA